MLALQLALDALLLVPVEFAAGVSLLFCYGIPATCTTTVTGALLTPSGVHTGVTRLPPSLTASGRTAPEVELPRMPKETSASPATARIDPDRISSPQSNDRNFTARRRRPVPIGQCTFDCLIPALLALFRRVRSGVGSNNALNERSRSRAGALVALRRCWNNRGR